MKTNFKTLALQAGIGAVLAAGSMSASAVITAVPAPAQLVPLFYYNTDEGIDTAVRVIVPKSVGSDTVLGIMRGDSDLTAQTSWNSQQQFGTGKSANNTIHYWVMNTRSEEIFNSSFVVTTDDEKYFYANESVGKQEGLLNGKVGSGEPTYLLLTTEAAVNGGNPDFMFSAEAWIENSGTRKYIASAVSIPVLGLADAADNAKYPTPGNNVVEDWLTLGTGTKGPVASPIHSGIRTSGTGAVGNLRVVDVPVHNSQYHPTTIVAWTDANDRYKTVGLYAVDTEENQTSRGSISMPDQLNFFNVGIDKINEPIGVKSAYTSNLSTTGLGDGGFYKMVIPAVAIPSDATEKGSYSSVMIFTIPAGLDDKSTDASEIAVDTGWFSGQ